MKEYDTVLIYNEDDGWCSMFAKHSAGFGRNFQQLMNKAMNDYANSGWEVINVIGDYRHVCIIFERNV